MADNGEFQQQITQGWRAALGAVRKAGGTQITLPVTDLALILDAVKES